HQYGYANVVACMGTSLTADQLQTLQRYTSNFVMALDADVAGQQATIRGLNQARQALTRVRKPMITPNGTVRIEERLGATLAIISMPAGRDPDDVIRQAPQDWQTLVAGAQPLVDFYFNIVAQQYDLTSARGKGQAVAELTPLIAELDDEIERQHYAQRLSRQVQIDEMTILGRVQAAAKTSAIKTDGAGVEPKARKFTGGRPGVKPQRTPLAEPATPTSNGKTLVKETDNIAFNQEDHLLATLLRQPDLLIWLSSATSVLEIAPLQPDDLRNTENQEIFRALKQFISSDEQWDLELFQELLTAHLHGRLAQLLTYGANLPATAQSSSDVALQADTIETLIRIRIERVGAESKNIKFLQDDAKREGDPDGEKQFGAVLNQHKRNLFYLQQSRLQLSQTLFRKHRPPQGMKIF
ncbi:MAG: toprim domain-containing protein, partial [Chloroflexota bacterium]|nr:toprim domain-containing protein [Chloroflexota bacterium]